MLPLRRCGAASSHRVEKAERQRRRGRALWPRTVKENCLCQIPVSAGFERAPIGSDDSAK